MCIRDRSSTTRSPAGLCSTSASWSTCPTAATRTAGTPRPTSARWPTRSPPTTRPPARPSESIFSPLAAALGLSLITPPSFLKAISEGTDVSPADKATIDQQIATGAIKVYVFNSQNSTPDVAAQVTDAKQRGIPVSALTETLTPATASFQDWQSAQLVTLQAALHQATGR